MGPEKESRQREGSVEVICGEMHAGKTEELIKRLRRLPYAKQRFEVFVPSIDGSLGPIELNSHGGARLKAIAIENPNELLTLVNTDTNVVAIDDAHFFNEELGDVCQELASRGHRVIVSGLDTDFRGEPWPTMLKLLAQCEELEKFHAICPTCSQPASRTQRFIDGKPGHYNDAIVVTRRDGITRESRCRQHHEVPGKP